MWFSRRDMSMKKLKKAWTHEGPNTKKYVVRKILHVLKKIMISLLIYGLEEETWAMQKAKKI